MRTLSSTRREGRSIAPADAVHARPRLLVTVRDPAEARAALLGGADLLDAKDPSAGPLGPCPPAVLRAIAAECSARGARRVPLSAALGDARQVRGDPGRLAAEAAGCGLDYLKIGLGGVADEDGAVALLRAVAAGAATRAPEIRVVAASYADAAEGEALSIRFLPRVAERAGLSGCLIDTAHKDGRSLLDHLPPAALSAYVAECRRRGLLCALAGSLSAGHMPLISAIAPDFIGVRGALCSTGRTGRLDPARLSALRAALHAAAAR